MTKKFIINLNCAQTKERPKELIKVYDKISHG